MKLIGHIKTHNTKSRCGNPSNTYTKPPKFSVLSFRRILVWNLTMVWVRPTAPLLSTLSWFIRTTILKRTFPNTNILQSFSLPKSGKQKCCICKNTQIHSLFLQTHPWPLNHEYYSVFSIIILNPTPSTLININQKTNPVSYTHLTLPTTPYV